MREMPRQNSVDRTDTTGTVLELYVITTPTLVGTRSAARPWERSATSGAASRGRGVATPWTVPPARGSCPVKPVDDVAAIVERALDHIAARDVGRTL